MLQWIVFKPRGPESGSREVERQRDRERERERERDKLVVEKVKLSWALNQLISRNLLYFV